MPANFFGPGHLSAYVGIITTQQVEDSANVNFVVEPCNEFLGLIRKQRLPPKLAEVDFELIKQKMGKEIDYFYQS